MNVEDLLTRLADGEFHSGEALAQLLQVSRTAVWKHVGGLADLGIEVERTRGRGYRIPGGLDLLDEARITAALQPHTRTLLADLQVHSQVDSTNALLLRHAEPLAGGARVALAEMQSSGRGRRGKAWVSPFARNIYLSLDWRFDGGVSDMEGLSLAIGVAVVEALASCGAEGLRLKWPNDLLHEGRKLGGVLVELGGDAAGPSRAVVGIGINVAMPESTAESVDQPWTDLATVMGRAPARNEVAAALVDHCLHLLAAYPERGFAAVRERWMALDSFADAPVFVWNGASHTAGTARGVDERGSLLLETAAGLQHISGGEVSLRPADQG